uniref:Uncharacterized protein n=1 Tax=Chelydra serpentina TaxID=8475 RepID=A0A8C3SCG3_CHESE
VRAGGRGWEGWVPGCLGSLCFLLPQDLSVEGAVPVGTGLAFDERLTEFHCLWDDSFPERPERLAAVKGKLLQCGLWERCVPVEVRDGGGAGRQDSWVPSPVPGSETSRFYPPPQSPL